MKVEVKELENLAREIAVEVSADDVNAKMEKMFADLRKEAELKGFRKGKAPMERIRSIYGDRVKAEVIEEVIRDTYPNALKESELKVATQPAITDINFTDDGSFVYTAKVEVMPEIESVSMENLEVTTRPVEVTDKEVEEVSEQLRQAFVEYRSVDREATEHDKLIVDLKKTDDPNNVIPDDFYEDADIDLTNPQTLPEFREHLPGSKVGDEKEIAVTFGDGSPDPKMVGQTVKYEVLVKDVQEKLLPEFDDAFARQTKHAETALELKLKLREDLTKQKEEQLKKEQRNAVIRQMCEQNKIQIPEKLIDDYIAAVIEDAKRQQPGLDESQAKQDYREPATNTLRWNMIYHHVAEQEKIEVLPEDTENMINRFAQEYKMEPAKAKAALQQSGKVETMKDTILEEKVLDFLVGRAKVVHKE